MHGEVGCGGDRASGRAAGGSRKDTGGSDRGRHGLAAEELGITLQSAEALKQWPLRSASLESNFRGG